MPYCTQCGNQVGATDRFCAKCGKAQATAAGAPFAAGGPGADPFARINAVDTRTASLLCYIPVAGWIMSIIVLASAKYRDDFETRFHAFQGLYLFVAWLITDWVLSPIMGHGLHLGSVLKAAIMFAWIFMLIKVAHRERFKLPIIGDLAEKSVSEQRV